MESISVNRMRKMDLKDKKISKAGFIFNIPLDEIKEQENWNVRDYDNPATKQHIRNIADAIKKGESFKIDPITVFVENGEIYVADGHCRRRAALLAREEGAEVEKLPAFETLGNKDDRLALISTSNKGLNLNPIEKARIYQRYANWGRDIGEIKDKVQESESHIKMHLELLTLPVEIQKLIILGKVSYTTALSEYHKFDSEEEAVEAFSKGADLAEAKGKRKITPKVISGDVKPKKKNKKYTKKIVGKMSETFIKCFDMDSGNARFMHDDSCEITIKLSKNEVAEVEDLMDTLRAIIKSEQKDDEIKGDTENQNELGI